jgi:Xaa-Pro aminopeptidase
MHERTMEEAKVSSFLFMPMPSTGAPPATFRMRRQRLQEALEARKLGSLLVTHPVDIAYLTGFRGSAGLALFTRSEAILWVDPRYALQAHEDARGVEIVETKRGLVEAAGKVLRKRSLGRLGFDDAHLNAQGYLNLRRALGGKARLVAAGDLMPSLRMIKGEEEIATMREAGRVTVEAFAETLGLVKPGMSECDLAAELDYRARRKGAEGMAFETIVASGARGAFPHARPSRKLLEECDLVIVDAGAIIKGYAADMSRTLYLGKPGNRVRKLYSAILEAQSQGIQALRDGVHAGKVDSAARNVLDKNGLGRYFTHSTGHGVGMEVHEAPRLGKRSKTPVCLGCVVTIEPGIYLEGFGGIRIEDTVLVGAGGPEILTPASKTHWFLA